MTLTFEPTDDQSGIDVIDQLERQRYRILTPDPVSPQRTDADAFQFPVGAAVRIRTSAIVLPTAVPVYVRDDDGTLVAEATQFDRHTIPEGTYSLDLCTRIKTYLEVETGFEVSVDMERTRIDFGAPTEVRIGSRSRHDRPAATVTTTGDPLDVMAAVETFGSALKTTDPERSYPTLRGHPPAIELGEQLDVPSSVERPDTGVRLELPPRLSSVFVAAPLAYYLGARLVPSQSPRLTTEAGFEHSLDTERGFEAEVGRTLKQLFLLDCVTRTEGYYEIELHERAEIEPHVDLDFETLYERPLAEQVASYLRVPYDLIGEHVPEWRLTTHIEPVATNAEQLPFVVDDLAIVRTHEDHQRTQARVPAAVEEEFTRDDVITRSASAAGETADEYVEPTSEGTLEQAWIGESIPIGASKLTVDAFMNRLARETTDGDISITVVQNDARMDDERELVDGVYGARSDLPFDVTVHQNLTTDGLTDVLTDSSDFFHYIGHTDRAGFTCSDGKLDATTLGSIGVDTFLLNACNSYHQGLALVEHGAIGGIVTLNEVINERAVGIGESIARLLNSGFPLRAALTVAREQSVMGGQYIVVGDGGITVTQPASGTPNLLDISVAEDGFDIEIHTYSTDDRALGSVFMPYLEETESYYLSSGSIDTFHVSEAELGQFLQLEEVPVRIDGELYWSTSVRLDEIL